MLVGGRHRNVDHVGAEIGASRDVGRVHAAPHHEARGELEVGDGTDGVTLLVAHGRDADFQFGHANGGELTGDVQFFGQRERHAS